MRKQTTEKKLIQCWVDKAVYNELKAIRDFENKGIVKATMADVIRYGLMNYCDIANGRVEVVSKKVSNV